MIRTTFAIVAALAIAPPTQAPAGSPSIQPASRSATQVGKKIYISADMEGISGIVGDDQLSPGGSEYGRSRKLMAEDVNAAVRGALAGGATEIVVNDSHGGQRNLSPEDLDPSARLISHSFKRYGMMEGLDETFHAVIFIGYHAKADTPGGLFAHTGSGVVRDLQIEGRSVGEGGMNTMLAEWYGVPVVLVTGDDVAVAQVREVAIAARGVVVKRAINVRATELMSLREARKEIEASARIAVASATATAPKRPSPVRVRLRYRNFTYPEIAEAFPSIRRVDPDTIEFSAETMPAAYRLIRVLYRFINPD
jgi:D-amino peptidase